MARVRRSRSQPRSSSSDTIRSSRSTSRPTNGYAMRSPSLHRNVCETRSVDPGVGADVGVRPWLTHCLDIDRWIHHSSDEADPTGPGARNLVQAPGRRARTEGSIRARDLGARLHSELRDGTAGGRWRNEGPVEEPRGTAPTPPQRVPVMHRCQAYLPRVLAVRLYSGQRCGRRPATGHRASEAIW